MNEATAERLHSLRLLPYRGATLIRRAQSRMEEVTAPHGALQVISLGSRM